MFNRMEVPRCDLFRGSGATGDAATRGLCRNAQPRCLAAGSV